MSGMYRWLVAREAYLLTWADVRYFQQIIVALTRAADTLSEIEDIFAD